MYVFGLLYGLNYEEASVYVCIYGLPIFFMVMAMVVCLTALYNWVRKMSVWSTLNFMASSCVTWCFVLIGSTLINFYEKCNVFHENYNTGNPIHDKFSACVGDLALIARDMGMTYEEVNMYIYVYLPVILTMALWLWFEVTYQKRWIINRLWKKKQG